MFGTMVLIFKNRVIRSLKTTQKSHFESYASPIRSKFATPCHLADPELKGGLGAGTQATYPLVKGVE